MAYFIWPWCLLGGYSAQAIKECIDYELKSADIPYVLANFCKLLSLTYYNCNTVAQSPFLQGPLSFIFRTRLADIEWLSRKIWGKNFAFSPGSARVGLYSRIPITAPYICLLIHFKFFSWPSIKARNFIFKFTHLQTTLALRTSRSVLPDF